MPEAQLQAPIQTVTPADASQPSTALGGDDTFWDRPNIASSAAAESRAKQLQPALQDVLQQNPDSSQQGEGGSETPFADVAEQSTLNGSSSNAESEPMQVLNCNLCYRHFLFGFDCDACINAMSAMFLPLEVVSSQMKIVHGLTCCLIWC